jgi:hypothetical protein
MATQDIPDFTASELDAVREIAERRYGKPVHLELADSELRLDPGSTSLILCPTVYWAERSANFVIFKAGESRYRCQFYYSVREQYGTGIVEFTDIRQCATTLLQVQADHEAQRQGIVPEHERAH